ncbi:hypothetical protein FBU30_003370 [Linnemannia zychae]|nr:hypothetical protein FBU30_003370 [Linnemannia zychae]
MKTPPYHCELQPIEKIWAIVKNIVASKTTGNMTPLGLKQMLVELFFGIPNNMGFRDVSDKYWTEVLKTVESYDACLRIAIDSVEVINHPTE